ncbi:hypothetical protein DEU56DRAFT_816658 [Suillus clintonianus]|uniref:uncharacterized protein n=1 Tax=Suillus clintonianus TaxID=1904413 RepID=UPI001B879D08|nr:uncharacterized protein DEU56DRAFT_816658 [Suillus clintonianus]KAG2129779.1 hypothetical protein DEU56DRAFT_816658 [Suillus clintonianus]
MTLLTTLAADANYLSSARVIHASPSLPDLYSSSSHNTHRLRRSSPPMNTAAALSSVDLQQHIYNSLLESRTADVSLHVHGTWEAIYMLHRVVLIQSGFFSSLFTAGFLESSPKLRSRLRGPEEIDVIFDDRNITRAAFEICIARLYGGGPPLYVPPSLIPSTSHPLTPSFSGPPLPCDTPKGHHTASPQLLLSLLATAVYLSIPSMASQAVNCIMNTVGPYTVIPYLNFAIGKAIEARPDHKAEAAVGLECIAQSATSESHASSTSRSPLRKSSTTQEPADDLSDKLHDLDVQKEDPAESEVESEPDEGPIHEPHFHYGLLSDKIGEAAACWIARWGADMLIHEEKASRGPGLPVTPVPVPAQTVSSRKRADTMPAKPSSSSEPTAPEPHVTPVIWARGGLNSKWVQQILGSDLLFVKGERERYDMACTIVELRRRQGIDAEEEKDWEILFREGIYYANMLVDDIIAISQHISPTTGRTFVPLSVLQEAHWDQSLLRCQITAKHNANTSSSSSPSSSPPPSREKELGLSITTAEILARLPALNSPPLTDDKDKPYHPVGHDSSVRIGDCGNIEGASMDQLFESPPSLSSPSTDSKAPVRATTSEANFFGLKPERQTASGCIASDATGKARWSPHPPFRFAVEFWDIDALKEKSRLHSQTIWYAGSLFNVYVQVVRKKGIQLGVYLHRQSNIDPIPAASAPLSFNRAEHTHNRVPSLPLLSPSQSSPSMSMHYSPSIHPPSRSTTPSSSPPTSSGLATSFTSSPSTIPATTPPVAPVQPYRDPRPAVAAYFTISCASSTGSSITRFTSVPDVFSVSQSWGWKSSSLRTEEYLEVGPDGQPAKPTIPAPKLNSLRATIVLGIV